MEYKIIVNPAAGKGTAIKRLPYLESLLKAKGVKYQIDVTKAVGHGVELARRAVVEGWPAVAAMGGDGTANEVANGLAGSETPLGLIPAGTGNDLARSLGIPKSLEEIAKMLADPMVASIDLGEDQGSFFLCIDGIGFPAEVMRNVNLSQGILSGSLAIVWGIIKTLKELRGTLVRLDLDGRTIEENVQGIFIMNTVYAGGGLKFSPGASHTDGLLDVLVMRDMSRAEVMGLLPRVYRGTHLSHPKVDFYRVKEIGVYPGEELPKMLDGNVNQVTPIRARVCDKSLKILAPQLGII